MPDEDDVLGQWPRHVVARWARRAGERRRAAAVIDFPRFPLRPSPALPPPSASHPLPAPDNEVNGRRERLLNFNYTRTPVVHV